MKFRITATTEYDPGTPEQIRAYYHTTDVEKMLEIDRQNAIDILSWSEMAEWGNTEITVEVVKDA